MLQKHTNRLTLDGASGEGGGQILRTSLSLSAATGRPVRIEKIRAGRKKPGLLRQHLTAVQAAAAACNATVEGAELKSPAVTFVPGDVVAGDYHFSIGTAGSTTLVLQTILPPLLLANATSTVRLSGGTHNPMAPPFEFLAHAFLPQLRKMGADVDAELLRPGFFPAGGGELHVTVRPSGASRGLELMERGAKVRHHAVSAVANLRNDIAKRENERIESRMKWPTGTARAHRFEQALGHGNVVSIHLEHENVTEVATAFGRKGHSAEAVADEAVDQAREYLNGPAVVGEHLADQLLLPMVLLGGGRFVTGPPSSHLTTNINTVREFLGDCIRITGQDDGTWMVEVDAS